jgi:hypothetical protein
MIILVAFVGLFVFAGLRLTPIYLNYMKVVGVVDGVRDEFDGTGANLAQIRNSVQRRFEVEGVSEIRARDIKIVAASGGYEISATYEHSTVFIGNVSFTVQFDKRALVRR